MHWRERTNEPSSYYRKRNELGAAILVGALFGLTLLVACSMI
jgi:hypothetical protein